MKTKRNGTGKKRPCRSFCAVCFPAAPESSSIVCKGGRPRQSADVQDGGEFEFTHKILRELRKISSDKCIVSAQVLWYIYRDSHAIECFAEGQ